MVSWKKLLGANGDERDVLYMLLRDILAQGDPDDHFA
jgi:hypothetical protein